MVKLTKREKLQKKVTKLFSIDEQKELKTKTDSGQPTKLATTTVQMPAANGVASKQAHQQSAIKLKNRMYSPHEQSKKSNNTTTATKSSALDNNATKLINNGNKNVFGDTIKKEPFKMMAKHKKSNDKFSPYTKSQVKDNKAKQTVTSSKDIKPTMIELKFNQAQGGDAASRNREKAGTTSNGISSNGTASSAKSSTSKSTHKAPPKKPQKPTNLVNSNLPNQVNNNKMGNGIKPKVPLKRRPALAKKPKDQTKKIKLTSKRTQKKDVSSSSSSHVNICDMMDKLFPGFVPGGNYYHAGGESSTDDDDEEYSLTCSDDSHEYHPFNDHHEYASSNNDSYTEIDTDDLSSAEKCEGSSPERFSEDNEYDFLNQFDTPSDVDDSSDEDYKPPIDIPEPLFIHRGTATKYEIPEDEPVLLCSDKMEAHVVEIQTESKFVSIKQPKEYEVDALNKLNEMFKEVQIDFTSVKSKKKTEASSCPELVPVTESDLESLLQTDDSFDEHYEEMSDDDGSIVSEDINDKYIASEVSSFCESDYEDLEEDDEPIPVATVINHNSPDALPPIKFDDNNITIPTPMEADCSDFFLNVPLMENATSRKVSLDSFKSFAEVVEFESSPTSDESPHTSDERLPTSNESPHTADESAMAEQASFPTCEMSTQNSIQSRNIFCNAINSNDVLVLLKNEIYIYGTVRLTLVYGTTDVYGYMPERQKSVEIYSPRGCSLVQITPKHGQIGQDSLESILKQYEETFTHANLKEILKSYTPGEDAVLLLQRNDRAKKLVSNFKKFMSENVFPNMKSLPTDRPVYTSEYLLQCFINNDSDKGLQVSTEWQNIKLNDQTKMILAGGKSVGKSTLLRYLVNRNLKQFPRILIIDLDIGQSELFVPQTVSCTVVTDPLLGPGFFLKHQPDKAFMVGHVNVALCAETYMRAVKELLEYCHSQLEYADLPWLINTMGYNKGFGLELFACVADYVRPTDIVQLQSNKDINNFGVPLKRSALKSLPRIIFGADEFKSEESAVEPACKLHVLYSAVMQQSRYQKEWAMSAKDLRFAMLVARLSGALQGNAEWLTDCMPLSAPLNSIQLVNMLTREGTRDELLAAVETNLVYLCQMEAVNAPLECFGIGIVRGVDHNVNQVYLLPATHYNRLQDVNCLALGEMPLPNSLFINQGPKVRGIAPFVYSTVDANASKAVKQIYHRPAEFLTGVHRKI